MTAAIAPLCPSFHTATTMYGTLQQHLQQELASIENAGLFKRERIITSDQGAEITVNGRSVLNFCANNYLGLSSHPEVTRAAHAALDSHGFGMSSGVLGMIRPPAKLHVKALLRSVA